MISCLFLFWRSVRTIGQQREEIAALKLSLQQQTEQLSFELDRTKNSSKIRASQVALVQELQTMRTSNSLNERLMLEAKSQLVRLELLFSQCSVYSAEHTEASRVSSVGAVLH
jgi:hypothetical protein